MDSANQQPEPNTPQTENCLNCGARLDDRWCAHCGQDSKEFKRSVWQVFMQFFETFTDFDSKLWSSLGPLLIKPGFLTKEFLAGRRKSYLNPIQMYAFFSFLFFLTAFYMPDLNHGTIKEEIQKEFLDSLGNGTEKEIAFGTETGGKLKVKDLPPPRDSVRKDSADEDDTSGPFEISGIGSNVREFDSIQAHLPPEKRYGPTKHFIVRKFVRLNERFKTDKEQLVSELIDSFKDNLPNLVILLLPLVALILKLLFIRRGIFYVEHLIMAIHFHCFGFLLLSVWLFITSIVELGEWPLFVCQVILFVYLYKTFRNVYRQGRFKTFVKVNMLGFTYFFMLAVGLILNLVFSAFILG